MYCNKGGPFSVQGAEVVNMPERTAAPPVLGPFPNPTAPPGNNASNPLLIRGGDESLNQPPPPYSEVVSKTLHL